LYNWWRILIFNTTESLGGRNTSNHSLPEPLTDTVNGFTIKGCDTSVIKCLSNSSVIDFSIKFACFKDDILFFKIISVGKYQTVSGSGKEWLLVFLPPKLSVVLKINILHQSKSYKNHFENSNCLGMWPLGHVVHVTYSFINMLFISTGIFDDKLRPQFVGRHYRKFPFNKITFA
jgi:hypothetical protein